MQELFKNNFYLSENFVKVFEPFIKINYVEVNNKRIPIYNKKTIGWHTYSPEEVKELNKKGIKVSSLSEKEGNYIYSFIPTKKYEETYKNYNKNFKKNVRRSERNGLVFVKEKDVNSLIKIYTKRMKELNTFVFPKKYFEYLISLDFVKIFFVKKDNKKIAFGLTFENENNVYFSQASDLKEFRDLKTGYFMYDQVVKYANNQGKYLHLGINFANSGQAIFKERMGASKLTAITTPKDNKFDLFEKVLKIPYTGYFFRLYSKNFFKSFLGNAIPFT